MKTYFVVFGRNPTLSFAEIYSVLKSKNISFRPITLSQEVLVFSTQGDFNEKEYMKLLGGTVKMGQVTDEVGFEQNESLLYDIFSGTNLSQRYVTAHTGKIHIGISIYDAGAEKNLFQSIVSRQKHLYLTVKDNLRKIGLKAGFVQIKERFLSSVSVEKNKMLTHGAEIVLIVDKQKIFIGKTSCVQEFEEFSLRDFNRPKKDKRSGIIPPKLARILINFTYASAQSRVLDPFCGSGTILQEAIMLGVRDITGSDISERAIRDTKENIEWLFQTLPQIQKKSFNIQIFQSDVKTIINILEANMFDVIVTEPYLGPPFLEHPSERIIQNTLEQLRQLYISAFQVFSKILMKRGRISFVFPVYKLNGKLYFVEILESIKRMGFVQQEFFPKSMELSHTLETTSRDTILYGGQEQFIKREIICFQKI